MKTQLLVKPAGRFLLSGATFGIIAMGCHTQHIQAQPRQISIDVAKPSVKISPTLYGLMTEEINYSYDGGLYAELIRNRVFKDDAKSPAYWSVVNSGGAAGTIQLDQSQPVPGTALGTSLRLDIANATAGARAGVANTGFWGIPVKPNTSYRASFYAKKGSGFSGPLTVSIESNDGSKTLAQAKVSSIGPEWAQYTVKLRTGNVPASTSNRFVISGENAGTVWLNQVSLFPPTYKNRPNGNRIDLMQKLVAMKPTFLRFPGGNYLEGVTIAERFDWKKTLGPISQRPGHPGPWGYRSTDGLGLLEFLNWTEDMKGEPVLAVFAGYALGGEHVAGEKLEPFIQDALDEIEYVTGDKNTKWGARRIADGHPAPIKLRYVEIGNEDWFDKSGSYDQRFTQFYDALKAKYPQLQLIATANVKTRTPDLYDDHLYASPEEVARRSTDYDFRDRKGPKVFVGEWASQDGGPTPTMKSALGDAAYMTGLERNSDIVAMQCYAPLLVNVNPGGRQWTVNMIGYDAMTSFASPSYYAQLMFANNKGDLVLPTTVGPNVAEPVKAMPHGSVGVGAWNTEAEFKDLRVTQDGKVLYQSDFTTGTSNWQLGAGDWKTENGSLIQRNPAQTGAIATVGDTKWGDYTFSLKARKISGAEGFLIPFHYQDENNVLHLNLGGWNNTEHAIQSKSGGQSFEPTHHIPGSIETGRWYDIRIEVLGTSVKAYLDNKLIFDVPDATPRAQNIFATSSRDLKNGDVILKLVNTSADAEQVQINLNGAKKVNPVITGQVLSGAAADVNTIENPTKIVPHAVTIQGASRSFMHSVPAHSISVLRIKAK